MPAGGGGHRLGMRVPQCWGKCRNTDPFHTPSLSAAHSLLEGEHRAGNIGFADSCLKAGPAKNSAEQMSSGQG